VNVFLSILAAIFYTVCSARLFMALGRAQPMPLSDGPMLAPADSEPMLHRRITLGLATIALLLHAYAVYAQTGLPHALSMPFFTALAVTALGIVLLQLALCLTQPADYLGLAIYPLAAIALLASQVSEGQPSTLDHAIQIHVLLSVLAYALLALAAVQAVLVAVQRHFLSRHKPGGFMHALPPFETTESLLFALLAAGFGLLTLSLASGFFYLEDMFAQHLVHKTVLSCLAWGIFGILLFGRWRFGWRGRRALQWTITGFIVLILAYFGSKLVLELILHRT